MIHQPVVFPLLDELSLPPWPLMPPRMTQYEYFSLQHIGAKLLLLYTEKEEDAQIVFLSELIRLAGICW